MIFRNGNLVTEAHKEVLELIEGVQEQVQKKIGAIYKGSQLIWLTIYNTVKSCYGSGRWLEDRPWLDNDTWLNN